MLERSSIVKLAFRDGHLILSGRPYREAGMSKQKLMEKQALERKHKKLFRERPEFLRPDPESLEQPYAGEVVDTFTTDSAYQEPYSKE